MSSALWRLQDRKFVSPVTDWELELQNERDAQLKKKWLLSEIEIVEFDSIVCVKSKAAFLRTTMSKRNNQCT